MNRANPAMWPVRALLEPLLALLGISCSTISTPSPETTSVRPSRRDEARAGQRNDLRPRGAFRAEGSRPVSSDLDDPWLSVTVLTVDAIGRTSAIEAGDDVRAGDQLIVEIDLHEPAHIYVISVDAADTPVLLYPEPGNERDLLLGRGIHRVPPDHADRAAIEMDDEVGTEYLFFIAATEPIGDLDHGLGDLVGELEQGGTPEVLRPVGRPATNEDSPTNTRRTGKNRPREQNREEADVAFFADGAMAVVPLQERGAFRSRKDGSAVDGCAGADGIVVIPFELRHR